LRRAFFAPGLMKRLENQLEQGDYHDQADQEDDSDGAA
jgi:hypothetical protein